MAVPPPSRDPVRPGPVEVEVLRWPEDGDRRRWLQEEGRPRLLLLTPDALPPPPDPLEDWAWSPIDERDLASRLRRLAHRAGDPEPVAVDLDADGVLRAAGRLVPLPPVEAALLRCLGEQPGRVRSRAELRSAAWGPAPRAVRSLDSRILSLRRRVRPLGLAVVAVRGEGFGLAAADDGDRP